MPTVTPIQGPIFLKNGSVPVVPLFSYPTLRNGSFMQIPVRTNNNRNRPNNYRISLRPPRDRHVSVRPICPRSVKSARMTRPNLTGGQNRFRLPARLTRTYAKLI